MLKGFINLSTDPMYCYEMTKRGIMVVSLDEENDYPELLPNLNSNVISGTCLLPSPEVMWAMIDGDENKFNVLYYEQLISRSITEFIYTLIGYLYKGGNVVIYTPNITEATKFLLEFVKNAYGINIGTSENNIYSFDLRCIPMYCIGIYSLGIIDPYEFLNLYPLNAEIPEEIYTKLIVDIQPFSEINNYYEKKNVINNMRGNGLRCPIKFIMN